MSILPHAKIDYIVRLCNAVEQWVEPAKHAIGPVRRRGSLDVRDAIA